jgi:hypothetical protein
MAWMNESEIERAMEQFRSHPVLGKYARFLGAFRDEVNGHSDGWAYWKLPAKAAEKLMTLLYGHLFAGMGAYPKLAAPTEAGFKKTLTPIKAFYAKHGTKAGMQFPELEGEPTAENLIHTITIGDWDANALEVLRDSLNRQAQPLKITFRLHERTDGALELWSSRRLQQYLIDFAIHYAQGFVEGFSVCASPDSRG